MQQRVREDAAIIDGKAFAAGMRARITGQVSKLKREHGITPGLAVVLVGEHPASQVYVRNKNKQTKEAGCSPTSTTARTGRKPRHPPARSLACPRHRIAEKRHPEYATVNPVPTG